MTFRPISFIGELVLRVLAMARSKVSHSQGRRPQCESEATCSQSVQPEVCRLGDCPISEPSKLKKSNNDLDIVHNRTDPLAFDPVFYLSENSDVREAGIDPLAHYMADGRKEGRAPNAFVKNRAFSMGIEELCTADRREEKQSIYDKDFRISIVTPVYNTSPDHLMQLKYTILNQIYENWQWILIDDGSKNSETRVFLNEMSAYDDRIKVEFLSDNSGISAATNVALREANGDYVALVDHDDLLPRQALSSIYKYWLSRKDTDIFYTDECKLLPDGSLGWFWGKPDWSPAYLENTMYLGHLVVYRREFINRLGGFRPEFDGTQDYDLSLRAMLGHPAVCHVPIFGYIWRAFEGSTALNVDEKHYALERQKHAVVDYAQKKNPRATVQEGDAPGYWRICYPIPKYAPSLTYILYSQNPDRDHGFEFQAASDCIRALIEAEFYDNSRFKILISNAFPQTGALLRGLHDKDVDPIFIDGEERALREKVNELALAESSDYICIAECGVRPITQRGGADIISYMINNNKVGAVSPVFISGGKIWQNGTIMLRSGVGRSGAGQDRRFGGPNNFLRCRRETLAVSENMLFVSSENFRKIGGFNTSLPQAECVFDFSNRLRLAGLTCLVDPFVEVDPCLRLDISTSQNANMVFQSCRISEEINDPYFSKWYDQTRTDFHTRLDQISH